MLNKIMKNIILIIIIISIAGCSTTNIPMDKEIKIEAATADSVLVIAQDNIDVITSPAYIGSSPDIFSQIVYGIVNIIRSGKNKKAAKAIIDKMRSYDFRIVMNDALQSELKNVNSICFSDNNYIESDASKSRKQLLFDDAASDAVLFLYVEYKLENGTLRVAAEAEMYPKSAKLSRYKVKENAAPPKNLSSAIYRNDFLYVCPIYPTINGLVQALNDAARNISLQLVADLNDTK